MHLLVLRIVDTNKTTNECYDQTHEQRARHALEKHPEVEELFRKVFLFIEF